MAVALVAFGASALYGAYKLGSARAQDHNQKVILVPPLIGELDCASKKASMKPISDVLLKRCHDPGLFSGFVSDTRVVLSGGPLSSAVSAIASTTIPADASAIQNMFTLRWQSAPTNPAAQLSLEVLSTESPEHLLLQGMWKPASTEGLSVFTNLSLLQTASTDDEAKVSNNSFVGARYVLGRQAQLGAILEPASLLAAGGATTGEGALSSLAGSLWCAGVVMDDDIDGQLMGGCQVTARDGWLLPDVGLVYRSGSLASGQPVMQCAVATNSQAEMLSLGCHMSLPVVRDVWNPSEDRDRVAGITSYLRFGFQTNLRCALPRWDTQGKPAPTLAADSGARSSLGGDDEFAAAAGSQLGASFQLNKNFLVKARVGSHGADAAVVARTWGLPCLVLALSSGFDDKGKPRGGMHVRLDHSAATAAAPVQFWEPDQSNASNQAAVGNLEVGQRTAPTNPAAAAAAGDDSPVAPRKAVPAADDIWG